MEGVYADAYIERIGRKARRDSKTKAGPGTIKRAIITHSLLQGAREERGMGFVGAFTRFLLSPELNQNLKGTLYSRVSSLESTTATPVISPDAIESIIEDVRLNMLPRLKVLSVPTESALSQEIQDQSDKGASTRQINGKCDRSITHIASLLGPVNTNQRVRDKCKMDEEHENNIPFIES
jgi:hypothetical protein